MKPVTFLKQSHKIRLYNIMLPTQDKEKKKIYEATETQQIYTDTF